MSAEQVPKQKTRGRPRLNLPKPDENGKCQHLEWFCPNKPKEMDPCDCPNANCAGCWYPCDKCGSTKCSPFCRRIRKSMEMRQAPIEWKKSF